MDSTGMQQIPSFCTSICVYTCIRAKRRNKMAKKPTYTHASMCMTHMSKRRA